MKTIGLLPVCLVVLTLSSTCWHLSYGFIVLPSRAHSNSALGSSTAGESDESFMSSLSDRVEEVKSTHQRLPIIVSSRALLPGREFFAFVDGDNKEFLSLIRSRIDEGEPYFGIVGEQRIQADNSTITVGTQAKITKTKLQTNGNTTVELEFRGTDRCFRLSSRPSHKKSGDWFLGSVEYVPKPSTKLSWIARYKLHRTVRSLKIQIRQYVSLMHVVDPNTLKSRLAPLGPVPADGGSQQLVLWIAAFLDDVTPLLAPTLSDRTRLMEKSLRSNLRALYKSIRQKHGCMASFFVVVHHKLGQVTGVTGLQRRRRRRMRRTTSLLLAAAAALLMAPPRSNGAISAAALMAIMARGGPDRGGGDNDTFNPSDDQGNKQQQESVVPLGEFE